MRSIHPWLLLAALVTTTPCAQATSLEELSQAVKTGKVDLSFRYRYEFVEQDGFSDDAGASTLKSRLTWTSAPVQQFTVGVEADYVALIGAEHYNSMNNGETGYPVVADPEGFDLNQAYVRYKASGWTATAGRQRILHADQRFVGGVGWRQNEQTYDALRLELAPTEGVTVDYSYVWNVNRIFGPDDGAQPSDWRGDTHILNAAYKIAPDHTVSAFVYLMDFENDNGIPNSNSTYGVAYSGQFGLASVNAAYATQSDYADSPLNYDADFYSISAEFKVDPVTLTAGYDVLGSDNGMTAFRTPLATLHMFQGWADLFLGTPAAGIEDTYAGVSGAVGKLKLAVTYHDFQTEEGSTDYGDEVDVVATYPLTARASVQLKYADYNADGFAVDTTKVWLSLMVNL